MRIFWKKAVIFAAASRAEPSNLRRPLAAEGSAPSLPAFLLSLNVKTLLNELLAQNAFYYFRKITKASIQLMLLSRFCAYFSL